MRWYIGGDRRFRARKQIHADQTGELPCTSAAVERLLGEDLRVFRREPDCRGSLRRQPVSSLRGVRAETAVCAQPR
jgi:hypothetical protein